MLLSRNSAKPFSVSRMVEISKSPSEGRTAVFRGESPQRIRMLWVVGCVRKGRGLARMELEGTGVLVVLERTTKWSVISVPTS